MARVIKSAGACIVTERAHDRTRYYAGTDGPWTRWSRRAAEAVSMSRDQAGQLAAAMTDQACAAQMAHLCRYQVRRASPPLEVSCHE